MSTDLIDDLLKSGKITEVEAAEARASREEASSCPAMDLPVQPDLIDRRRLCCLAKPT